MANLAKGAWPDERDGDGADCVATGKDVSGETAGDGTRAIVGGATGLKRGLGLTTSWIAVEHESEAKPGREQRRYGVEDCLRGRKVVHMGPQRKAE